jgi:hypothetical protein
LILLIDGPEKTGKTTIIRRVRTDLEVLGYNVRVRRWGPVYPDDRVYSPDLKTDAESPWNVTIWDRGWPSEHVYGKLLQRDRRLAGDPWLGEWLHRRVLFGRGSSVILLPADKSVLAPRRDATDLAVNIDAEVTEYEQYANRFGWTIYRTEPTLENTEALSAAIVGRILSGNYNSSNEPATVVGPAHNNNPFVAVIGDRSSDNPGLPGAWTPFSSQFTTEFGRLFGDAALGICWMNAANYNLNFARRAKIVVACGEFAVDSLRADGIVSNDRRDIIRVKHPACVYRWGLDPEKEEYTKKLAPAIALAQESWEAYRAKISSINA